LGAFASYRNCAILRAAPVGSVVGAPGRPPFDDRDRVSAHEELEANLVAGFRRDAMLAESLDVVDRGKPDGRA